jgi:hypothetical protein
MFSSKITPRYFTLFSNVISHPFNVNSHLPFESSLSNIDANTKVKNICKSYCQSQSPSYVTTHGQSASLSWCQAPIWDPRPIFLLLYLIFLRQLRICWCGAPSLTRRRVCNFQFLLGIASAAFLRSESHETHLLNLLTTSKLNPMFPKYQQ